MTTIATELHELETLRATMDLILALTDNPPDDIPREAIVTIVRDTVKSTRQQLRERQVNP